MHLPYYPGFLSLSLRVLQVSDLSQSIQPSPVAHHSMVVAFVAVVAVAVRVAPRAVHFSIPVPAGRQRLQGGILLQNRRPREKQLSRLL